MHSKQYLIFLVLALVLNAQTSNSQQSDDDNSQYDALFEWLRKGKAEVDKVEIVEYQKNYRGLRAKADLKKGDWAFFIPKTHFLFLEEVKKTCTINRKMVQLNIEPMNENTYFVHHMLQEQKRKNSFWQPFLQVLPTDTTIFPARYTEEEMNELKGSSVVQMLEEQRDNFKKEFEQISSQLADLKKYTYDDWLTYKLLASSRTLTVKIDDKWVQVLVPLADMINNHPESNVEFDFSKKYDGFYMTAKRPIRKGEELFLTYGQMSNKWFLMNYGFTSELITMNQFDFQLCEEKFANPLRKIRIAQFGGFDCHSVMIVDKPSHFKSREALSVFRVKGISKLNHWLQIEKYMEENNRRFFVGYTQPTSPQCEKEAWLFMKRYLIDLLKTRFPQTIEEDEALLSGNLSYNMRCIINIRLKEKQLVKLHIQTADLAVTILDKSVEELRKLQHQYEYRHLADYIKEELIPMKN